MIEIPYATTGDLPLTISPQGGDAAGADRAALCEWLRRNPEWVREKLTQHGALRFRGFDIREPIEFEEVAAAIDPQLKNEYLGTSPRDALTDYVFNASELPDYFPIAQHCEMSFCANPPSRVMFCCLDEPAEGSGETPLCDFRRVWTDLDPAVRERFAAGGIRIVRNYAGPGGERDDDPTQLKPWPEMFLTTDHEEVEEKCREEGFTPTWLEGDGLRLESTQAVTRDHPVTGEKVWHNHLTTFHVSNAVGEYSRICELRPTDRHRGVLQMARDLEKRLREQPSEERSMHSTYLDGSEFPDEDVDAVRDAVWKNMVIESWQRGDVVAIDNHSVSHGRLPYEGARRVVVAWA